MFKYIIAKAILTNKDVLLILKEPVRLHDKHMISYGRLQAVKYRITNECNNEHSQNRPGLKLKAKI